jgi:hypothetical protein
VIPNEKGRPAGGDPIPNAVCQDDLESKPQPLVLQVSRLTRRCAISAAIASAIAPLVYGATAGLRNPRKVA